MLHHNFSFPFAQEPSQEVSDPQKRLCVSFALFHTSSALQNSYAALHTHGQFACYNVPLLHHSILRENTSGAKFQGLTERL